MGVEPWYYFVKYQADVNRALQELRQREFQAGRYYPVIDSLELPIDENSPSPGAQHPSIEAALEAADDSGTGSILDIIEIAEQAEICVATPLSEEEQEEYFGTVCPTRELLEQEEKLWEIYELIGRGKAVYCVVYKNDQPDEILFAGYSFD
jgi:hypothetical protein